MNEIKQPTDDAERIVAQYLNSKDHAQPGETVLSAHGNLSLQFYVNPDLNLKVVSPLQGQPLLKDPASWKETAMVVADLLGTAPLCPQQGLAKLVFLQNQNPDWIFLRNVPMGNDREVCKFLQDSLSFCYDRKRLPYIAVSQPGEMYQRVEIDGKDDFSLGNSPEPQIHRYGIRPDAERIMLFKKK